MLVPMAMLLKIVGMFDDLPPVERGFDLSLSWSGQTSRCTAHKENGKIDKTYHWNQQNLRSLRMCEDAHAGLLEYRFDIQIGARYMARLYTALLLLLAAPVCTRAL